MILCRKPQHYLNKLNKSSIINNLKYFSSISNSSLQNQLYQNQLQQLSQIEHKISIADQQNILTFDSSQKFQFIEQDLQALIKIQEQEQSNINQTDQSQQVPIQYILKQGKIIQKLNLQQPIQQCPNSLQIFYNSYKSQFLNQDSLDQLLLQCENSHQDLVLDFLIQISNQESEQFFSSDPNIAQTLQKISQFLQKILANNPYSFLQLITSLTLLLKNDKKLLQNQYGTQILQSITTLLIYQKQTFLKNIIQSINNFKYLLFLLIQLTKKCEQDNPQFKSFQQNTLQKILEITKKSSFKTNIQQQLKNENPQKLNILLNLFLKNYQSLKSQQVILDLFTTHIFQNPSAIPFNTLDQIYNDTDIFQSQLNGHQKFATFINEKLQQDLQNQNFLQKSKPELQSLIKILQNLIKQKKLNVDILPKLDQCFQNTTSTLYNFTPSILIQLNYTFSLLGYNNTYIQKYIIQNILQDNQQKQLQISPQDKEDQQLKQKLFYTLTFENSPIQPQIQILKSIFDNKQLNSLQLLYILTPFCIFQLNFLEQYFQHNNQPLELQQYLDSFLNYTNVTSKTLLQQLKYLEKNQKLQKQDCQIIVKYMQYFTLQNSIIQYIKNNKQIDQMQQEKWKQIQTEISKYYTVYKHNYKQSLESLFQNKIKNNQQNSQTFSNLHQDVVLTLQELGYQNDQKSEQKYFEIETNIDCYFIDIMISPNIIIEVNGPKHYYFNDKQTLKQKYRIKQFTLQQLGYTYINIPYYDFKQYFFSEKPLRQKYLKDLLNQNDQIIVENNIQN